MKAHTNFLHHVLPYLEEDPRTALVQTPQVRGPWGKGVGRISYLKALEGGARAVFSTTRTAPPSSYSDHLPPPPTPPLTRSTFSTSTTRVTSLTTRTAHSSSVCRQAWTRGGRQSAAAPTSPSGRRHWRQWAGSRPSQSQRTSCSRSRASCPQALVPFPPPPPRALPQGERKRSTGDRMCSTEDGSGRGVPST
eukprot:scaffold13475_cov56-Isochrysis_galbana.AAC.1